MISKLFRAGISVAALCSFGWALPAHATGAQTFASRCAMCHQANGAGLPGQFPRLSGRAAAIAASKDGRDYLIKVLLFGMFGPIDVDGKRISGMMPSVGSLGDQDVADTLNFIVALEKPKKHVAPFSAAEVKAVRAAGKLTASGVAKVRAAAAAKGAIP